MTVGRSKKFNLCVCCLGVVLLLCVAMAPSALAQKVSTGVGERDGPFVMSGRNLSDLVGDGYVISGNLGNFLVLQKGASVFSCGLATDPEKLSYKPFFLCSELDEQGRHQP